MEQPLSYQAKYDMLCWLCFEGDKKMLELYELNVFVQAAETLSFTAAAARLNVSQPAVSMQISNLEKRLNTSLFDRSGRNIKLTEATEVLLPLAREIRSFGTHIEETMASVYGTLKGHLQIACSTSAGKYILPHLIARFRQLHPQVRVTVGICSLDGAVEQVCDGRCHWASSAARPTTRTRNTAARRTKPC
jgi:DNA-binding transcriptional LysR family regulator